MNIETIKKFWKIIILAVLFCFQIADGSDAAELEINQTGANGNQVTFTVSVNSTPNDVYSFGFDILYDANILRYDGKYETNTLLDGFLVFDVVEQSSPAGAGQFRVGWARVNPIPEGTSDELLNLTFDVVKEGESQVRFANMEDDLKPGDTPWSTNTSPNPLLPTDQFFSVDENCKAAGTVSATDDEDDTLSYSISEGADIFMINPSNGDITVGGQPDYETTDEYELTIEVSDGINISSATVTVNILDGFEVENQTFSVDENSPEGTKIGTVAATDPDETSLTFLITEGNTDNAFAINSSTGEIMVNDGGQPDYETTQSYELTVEVSDGTCFKTAIITLNINNLCPTTDDQSFSVNEDSANGTAVGTLTTYNDSPTEYSITGGNTNNAFSISNTGEIKVNDSTQLDADTSQYELTVEASDGTCATNDKAVVTLNIVLPDCPVLTTGQVFYVNENSANNTPVGTVAVSYSGDDPLTYSITEGNTGNAFAINNDGHITVANSGQLNYETTTGYALKVQVSDGKCSDTATVTVNLRNLNDNPPVVNASATFQVDENSPDSTVVGTVTASDPDHLLALTYSITGGNTGAFAINSTSGQITINDASKLDYETTASYTLTVQVSDGTHVATSAVTVNIGDVNERPLVNDQNFQLDENSADDTTVADAEASDQENDPLTYSITGGNTNNAFSISGTGKIMVNDGGQLDYETAPTYALTIQVSDGKLTDTAIVRINLNNVNDCPEVNAQIFYAQENSPDGTAVDTIVARDDDDDNDALTYTLTDGNINNAFKLDSDTGKLTVKDGNQLDHEVIPAYTLTVQVSDGKCMNSPTAEITVYVKNGPDCPIIVNNGPFDVDENSVSKTYVGTVLAVDDDKDSLAYSITDTNDIFLIDNSTGEITTNGELDYETTPEYELTVQVSDGNCDHPPTAKVIVNINDRTDPPVVDNQEFSVDEGSANGTSVGTIAASDEDEDDTLTFSITEGNTDNVFAIDPDTAEIIVNDSSKLTYRNATEYELTIEVSDGKKSATATITVDVKVIPGDTDGNGKIELNDAMLVLKVLAGNSFSLVYPDADVNGDGKIGVEELVYILKILSD
ncbi:cadherin domain-containing protein [Desulfococcaceae bacterium HSG8]|nr:cadherin domain-containing protein [Desulfococcaceae bacterium HSG8]